MSVTTVPCGYVVVQAGPHTIAPVLSVTVPVPCPEFLTVNVKVTGAISNWADTVLSTSITSVQGSTPPHDPLQPTNLKSEAGSAVNLTVSPRTKLAVQDPGQLIPPGALVTLPDPLTTTVRVDVPGGTTPVKLAVTV